MADKVWLVMAYQYYDDAGIHIPYPMAAARTKKRAEQWAKDNPIKDEWNEGNYYELERMDLLSRQEISE